MKKVINFLSLWGIYSTVLIISDYKISDIRHWLPVLIVLVLMLIYDSTKEVKQWWNLVIG